MADHDAGPRRRWLGWSAVVLVALAVGAGLGWAGRTVFTPPPDVLGETTYTYVEVTRGEVGSTMAVSGAARWDRIPLGQNAAVGTITSVDVEPGATVTPGTVLYTVDLRPVVIAVGEVPAFRDLQKGTVGKDVGQLHDLLRAVGAYSGESGETFGSATAEAVRRWQRQLGIPQDGVVHTGDIVFVPALPARVVLDPDIAVRGARLAGGEHIVSALSDTPSFVLPVTSTQAAAIPQGTPVELTAPDGTRWSAVSGAADDDESRGIMINLRGVDGEPICGTGCDAIAPVGYTLVGAKVITEPTVSGLVVPTAALLSKADGSVVVIGQDGSRLPVTVLGSARGISVIDGVAEGLKVRIPAADS